MVKVLGAAAQAGSVWTAAAAPAVVRVQGTAQLAPAASGTIRDFLLGDRVTEPSAAIAYTLTAN